MKSITKFNLDKLGICTSAFCAVHCIVTPLVLIAFPLTGLDFLKWEGFELGILIISFFLAVTSLGSSSNKKHRSAKPIIMAVAGFSLFVIGKLLSIEIAEILLSVLGGSLVVYAHYMNFSLSKPVTV